MKNIKIFKLLPPAKVGHSGHTQNLSKHRVFASLGPASLNHLHEIGRELLSLMTSMCTVYSLGSVYN